MHAGFGIHPWLAMVVFSELSAGRSCQMPRAASTGRSGWSIADDAAHGGGDCGNCASCEMVVQIMNRRANKITPADAGGTRHLPMRTRRAAGVAQFLRSPHVP